MRVSFDKVGYYYGLQRKSKFSFYEIGKTIKSYLASKRDLMTAGQKYWALKDISFEAGHGDIVGVIGRNGSGKSTLIRLIAQIFEPDQGKVSIQGRVSTLLSLSSGQLSGLTGRENIILTGLLMGQHKKQIASKVDQIIELSELGEFIDQPVKAYSSGMKSRLGFSTLMHVETDILLLDEIFSVGDGVFKQKAKRLIHDHIAKAKLTFLVSHSMGLIESTCNKVLWIEKGKQMAFGDTATVLEQYDNFINQKANK